MGRILEYVILLSNLSLILTLQYTESSHGNNYERGKQGNHTHGIKQYLPKEQNDYFNKKVLPLDFPQGRRRSLHSKPKQIRTTVGLQAFASDNPEWKARSGRNFSHSNLGRRNVPQTFSQVLYPRKNSKSSWLADFRGGNPSGKLTRVYSLSSYESKRPEEVNRRYKEGRNAKYHPRHSVNICDPCNSVPWVPVVKAPDSYRQQRTHVTELHPAPQQNFNFDYHGFASNTHNVLLPAVPLVPPLEPVYEGTISSSFGLPIGNIPTSHGLLAPINHNNYAANTIDYGSSFNFFAPHRLLESDPFPELSHVPMPPIHDSGQFYQFDSAIPDLVPPPAKALDVSNVVLTISEENPAKHESPKPGVFPNHKPSPDLGSGGVDHQASRPQTKEKNQNKELGRLEIVKSIPLAEFTSSVESQHQELPLYPPLQAESSIHDSDVQKLVTRQPDSDYDFLVPPVKPETNFTFNSSNNPPPSKSFEKSELQGESSDPKPLTSPSLSWLFSDHTAPPDDSKSTASVSSFATEAREIASVVNDELRPVSPHPVYPSSPSTQNFSNSKSKKIQIIIPYTTRTKSEHDNNALESVQHEVFQPPVSKSSSENDFRDLATSALPPQTRSETNRDRNEVANLREDEDKSHKYLKEMHHIIASNLRELLKEEILKSKSDQNYPLQKNIDNWTALEYSNHKTVETKAPKEIINQAHAVTSIPGTSISHLLLPSKKIPSEYFVTTPLPVYDEPSSSFFQSVNSTVNSSPFTAKPYATTSFYNPTKSLREKENQNDKNTPSGQSNHETNYTEIGRGRVNAWGKLNENLVLPEARSKTRRVEQTTSSWGNSLYVTFGKEKVQIVTPISLTSQRNYTTTSFRRTTRQLHQTINPTTQKTLLLSRLNSTRLEKVSNQTSPFNRKFTHNSTTLLTTVRVETTNSSVTVEASDVETNETVIPRNLTGEEVILSTKSERVSINDIFPFRNKELPWELNSNRTQVLPVGRQRKSLIKQANLQRSKAVVSSS